MAARSVSIADLHADLDAEEAALAAEVKVLHADRGRAEGVLLLSAELDRLSERARFVAAVEDGLAEADVGRLSDHDEVAQRMQKRFSAK